MTNTEMLNHWLLHQQRERGRSTSTLYSYRQDGLRLLEHLHPSPLDLVTTDDLRSWCHTPLTKGKRAGRTPGAATLKRRVSMCRSFFGHLHAEGMIPSNPSLRLFAPAPDNVAPKPIDLDVWKRLWASDLSDDDRVAFGVALFCGLRRIEVVGITAEHFQGERLQGFYRKGNKVGDVPWLSCVRFFHHCDPELLGGDVRTFTEPLERLRSARALTSPLVPWKDDALRTCPTLHESSKVDPQHLNRHLERALARAGMGRAAFTPHQLRHTFCTFLLDNGVPLLEVSRLAGHSSVEITQRYIKTADDPLAKIMASGGSDKGAAASEEVISFGRI